MISMLFLLFTNFRRKRAYTEYTRWRANAESTQEFIVKVLEDDLTTPKVNPVVAVNIRPHTKAQDKIIITGVFVPTPSTETNIDAYKNYQRFVPPTTVSLAQVSANVIFAPVKTIVQTLPPIRPKGIEIKQDEQHSQRDESPPAKPQFLPRSQSLIARQYAPIAPVSFTRSNTLGPLTPRAVDKFIFPTTTMRPSRTHSYPDVIIPRRTSISMDFLPYEYNLIVPHNLDVSQRTSLSTVNLHRTTIKPDLTESSSERLHEFQELRKSDTKNINSDIKKIDKESDLSYNDFFYNENDNDESSTKKEGSSSESHIDSNQKDSMFINYLEDSHNVTETDVSNSNYEDDDNDVENITDSSTTKFDLDYTTSIQSSKNMTRIKKNLLCSILKVKPLIFSSPQTLHEINTQLKKWSENSPIAKRLDITNGNFTVMENPIYMMMVDDPSRGQIFSAKQTVMIVAGIQGSDHHAVTAAMYLLYQLIERSEAHSDLLTKYRFWIIPVFNPDGYDYSMTFTHRREWSKNLRQSWDSCKGRDSCQACEHFGIRCIIQPCYGVNLDRNFEYQWIPPEELRAEHPCGALYSGLRQLSETETHTLTRFLHELRTPLFTFIAFKEGDILRQRASRAASAAYSISGRSYVAGQTSEFLPLYAGGIEDWVAGHLGIENTYTIMMFRPTDVQNSKIVTERVVHEAYAAVDTLLLQSLEPQREQQFEVKCRIEKKYEEVKAEQ
ncbi:unnamed protein product, partial [Brenthis ino]